MDKQIKTGGPAFPVPMEDRHCGMDLRDFFAAKAMQALIGLQVSSTHVASEAYRLADTMIAAREA